MNNKPTLQVIAHRLPSSNSILHGSAPYQSGAVLIISLIMLLLLTLIATTGMQTSSLEEKMAGNLRDKNLAFQAAESALKAAGESLAIVPAFSAAGTGGFYSNTPTRDLSDSEIVKDSFWTDTTKLATSTVTGLGNGITTPVYIIQDRGDKADCAGAAVGSLGCKYYLITARATGGSTNAVVILQSIYLR
jgi:type IV pilus assembly protein PilX